MTLVSLESEQYFSGDRVVRIGNNTTYEKLIEFAKSSKPSKPYILYARIGSIKVYVMKINNQNDFEYVKEISKSEGQLFFILASEENSLEFENREI